MDLVIDIGNTLQKIAIFNRSGEMVSLFKETNTGIRFFEHLFRDFKIERTIVSSVGHFDESAAEWLENHSHLLFFTKNCKLPITIEYQTPETLGTDRIAAAVGANSLFEGYNVLSIMAGTCLVTDFVRKDGVYLGGSISPGMEMRFKALSEHTARLPKVSPAHADFLAGNTTEKSIISGVINGMAFEINGFIDEYSMKYEDLKVVLSGGDAQMLHNYVKKSIFAAQNPTLVGLHKILELNVFET